MSYLLDTNIFIRSKNEMPIDLWPSFWERFRELIHSGQVFSIREVKEEIERGNDELRIWMKENAPKHFYLSLDTEGEEKYAHVQQWAANNPIFRDSAKKEFAEVADAFLVAMAAAKNMTVVTYEKSNPQSARRVLIPDACKAMSVRYCDLNTMLREMGITI